MQKPVKRGNAWRIQVRYKNLRDSVTRDTARECEQWAAIRLLEMKAEYDPKKLRCKNHIFHSLSFVRNIMMKLDIRKEVNPS